jgi:hypothetical protein
VGLGACEVGAALAAGAGPGACEVGAVLAAGVGPGACEVGAGLAASPELALDAACVSEWAIADARGVCSVMGCRARTALYLK